MSRIEPEFILLIGGGIVTVAVAVFVIVLLIRANRDHDRQLEQERHEQASPTHRPPQ